MKPKYAFLNNSGIKDILKGNTGSSAQHSVTLRGVGWRWGGREAQEREGIHMVAQLVKNPPAMQETPVRFLGWEVPLEKE